MSLRLILLALALACLAAAVTLTLTDHDAVEAWEAFTAAVGVLVGQHLPTPGAGP